MLTTSTLTNRSSSYNSGNPKARPVYHRKPIPLIVAHELKVEVSLSVRDSLPISPLQSAFTEPRGQYVHTLCMLSNVMLCCDHSISRLVKFSAIQSSAILTFYIFIRLLYILRCTASCSRTAQAGYSDTHSFPLKWIYRRNL